MGFSVTAAHAIFLVAMLAGGSSLGLAIMKSHEMATEARRVEATQRSAEVHTLVNVRTETWDGVAGRATFTIDNNGTTTLDVRLLDFVVDGVWKTDAVETGWTVDGDASDWWTPATTLTVALAPFAGEPSDLVVATEYGTTTVWRR